MLFAQGCYMLRKPEFSHSDSYKFLSYEPVDNKAAITVPRNVGYLCRNALWNEAQHQHVNNRFYYVCFYSITGSRLLGSGIEGFDWYSI